MVDIDSDEHAHHGRRIEQQTGGYRIVPTVEVGERLLVNPTVAEVTDALADSARHSRPNQPTRPLRSFEPQEGRNPHLL